MLVLLNKWIKCNTLFLNVEVVCFIVKNKLQVGLATAKKAVLIFTILHVKSCRTKFQTAFTNPAKNYFKVQIDRQFPATFRVQSIRL